MSAREREECVCVCVLSRNTRSISRYTESFCGSHGLMVRGCNPKVAGSSLGPAGIVGGGTECTALSPPSIPRLRGPCARHRTPNCSPGCPLLRVCVHGVCVFTAVCACSRCVRVHGCVRVHCCVCVHFGWDKCRAQIQSMGHHTWPHVIFTSLYFRITAVTLHSPVLTSSTFLMRFLTGEQQRV